MIVIHVSQTWNENTRGGVGWMKHEKWLWQLKLSTVKSTYKEPAYKELPVIRNLFAFTNLNPSLFYVKKMDKAYPIKAYGRIRCTDFLVLMYKNQSRFYPFIGSPLLVKFTPPCLIAQYLIAEIRVTVVTD